MIDPFDYKEPSCVLCGGKQFYNPNENQPIGRIPLSRVLEKTDKLFSKNDYTEAGRLLEYWKDEAVSLNDKHGELTITNELIGYYRKTVDKIKAYECIDRAMTLINELNQRDTSTYATVLLNCATAYKAFGEPNKSLPLFSQAEQIYIKTLPENDQRFAGLYNNMALSLVDLGEFNKAEDYYKSAISIMEKIQNGQCDLAITYVNMAHMYETFNVDKNKITDCLFNAYNLLSDENIVQDGYYAFVCSKCAPSYEHFGFNVIYNELTEISEKIYARN